MKYNPIVPAVIPQTQQDVLDFAKKLNFSREFHLDIVDGKFTPSVSWPIDPKGDVMTVKASLDEYTLEVDLMVNNPLEVASQWVLAGADMFVFHVETLSKEAFKNFAENTGVSVGVSSHGDTSLETLMEYAEFADYVQLMGIREIGSQGQPFDEGVLEKIPKLKQRFPKISITIDGILN